MIEGMNDIKQYEALTDRKKQVIADWIENNLTPGKTYNKYHSSYGLKHYMEKQTGLYTSNGTFKGAMLAAGYEPKDKKEINWIFKISDKSPALKININKYITMV